MATFSAASPFNRVFAGAPRDVVDVEPKTTGQRLRDDFLRGIQRTVDEEIARKRSKKVFTVEDDANAETKAREEAFACVVKAMGVKRLAVQASDVHDGKVDVLPSSHSPEDKDWHLRTVPTDQIAVDVTVKRESSRNGGGGKTPPPEHPGRPSGSDEYHYPAKNYLWKVLAVCAIAGILLYILMNASKTAGKIDEMRISLGTLNTDIKVEAGRITLLGQKVQVDNVAINQNVSKLQANVDSVMINQRSVIKNQEIVKRLEKDVIALKRSDEHVSVATMSNTKAIDELKKSDADKALAISALKASVDSLKAKDEQLPDVKGVSPQQRGQPVATIRPTGMQPLNEKTRVANVLYVHNETPQPRATSHVSKSGESVPYVEKPVSFTIETFVNE